MDQAPPTLTTMRLRPTAHPVHIFLRILTLIVDIPTIGICAVIFARKNWPPIWELIAVRIHSLSYHNARTNLSRY
jgi:hypothetical protein